MSIRSELNRLINAGLVANVRAKGAQVGEGVTFYGKPIVACWPDSQIIIGAGTVITSLSSRTALGINHRAVLRTMRPDARISLGERVGISGGSICAVNAISIGDGSMLGANCSVFDTDFHALRDLSRRDSGLPPADSGDEVHIGRNVFIGTNAMVLKGVTIGDHAVVGAGSVVTKPVPAGAFVAGVPARVLETWTE